MAVILTAIARVKDWQALRRLNSETLVEHAQQIGATRYRLYRNVKDAAQVLIVAELPDYEAVQELGSDLGIHLAALLDGGVADDRVWEATTFDGIG